MPRALSPFVRAGYFVMSERRRYDVQPDPSGNGYGLVLETLDPLYDPSHDPFGNPLRHRTTIAYDDYHLLPLGVTDPAGLTTHATYDYRVCCNQTDRFGWHDHNMYLFTAGPSHEHSNNGQSNTGRRDWTRPSVRMEYDFLSFSTVSRTSYSHLCPDDPADPSRDGAGCAPSANETKRSRPWEYSDGFGRLLRDQDARGRRTLR